MKFVDVSYYHNTTANAEGLLEAYRPNIGYMEYLPGNWDCRLVKFANAAGHTRRGRIQYDYFKGGSYRMWIPWAANRHIARQEPDVVLLHGLIFPQQVLALRSVLPKKTKLIIQHHAERPAKDGIMPGLQFLADKCVKAYLFSTKELAEPWIQAEIITKEKVFEVMEGSSVMQRIEKNEARQQLGLNDRPIFLWVGRLDKNKDPLTVLAGFEKYLQQKPGAKLYMVYNGGDLLPAIQSHNSVELVGKLERSELSAWYSAADYYISGSHSEGSGYALIEAMSCGCVPVVTNIPSFKKIAAHTGQFFTPGDADSLYNTLMRLENLDNNQLVHDVLKQFEDELSFSAIAEQIARIVALLP